MPTPLPTPLRPRFLIVDGHAFAYRSFHAIQHLNAPDGFPTNAIFGFIKALGKMVATIHPEYVLVLWDGGLAAERMEALPEYKAQRPPMPTDLEKQLDEIVHYVVTAGYTSFCQYGAEADDWIATIARHATALGLQAIIASADKDFMQLVSDNVALLNPNDKTDTLWTATQVRDKAGVDPKQIVDWLSLIGDSVDNIPGAPGIGPKTATALLNQFESLDALWPRMGEVKSEKIRASLANSKAILERNQALIRLNDQLAGEFILDHYRIRPADKEKLRELFARWGFKTMLSELGEANPAQGELF